MAYFNGPSIKENCKTFFAIGFWPGLKNKLFCRATDWEKIILALLVRPSSIVLYLLYDKIFSSSQQGGSKCSAVKYYSPSCYELEKILSYSRCDNWTRPDQWCKYLFFPIKLLHFKFVILQVCSKAKGGLAAKKSKRLGMNKWQKIICNFCY